MIQAIFDEDSIALVIALIAVMVLFGAYTARGRATRVPGAFGPLLIALSLAARRRSGWSSRSASSSPSRATWSRSAGW